MKTKPKQRYEELEEKEINGERFFESLCRTMLSHINDHKDIMGNISAEYAKSMLCTMSENIYLVLKNVIIPVFTSDKLPEPYPKGKPQGEYYLVNIGIYGYSLAMFLVAEKGKVGWYSSYTERIAYKVVWWSALPE